MNSNDTQYIIVHHDPDPSIPRWYAFIPDRLLPAEEQDYDKYVTVSTTPEGAIDCFRRNFPDKTGLEVKYVQYLEVSKSPPETFLG